MQWNARPGAGFTSGGVEPWLPIGDASVRNVEAQQANPDSVLNLTRSLIALRTSAASSFAAPYEPVSRDEGLWVWRRGDLTVAANLSGESHPLRLPDLDVVLSSDPARTRERRSSPGEIGPWESLILRPV
jgi:alpha-glucosidase